MFIACVLLGFVACHDTLPVQPRVSHPAVLDRGAPDVPVQGCATFEVRLTGGNGIVVTSMSTPSCGPIIPVLDSAASYDPATRTIRLPVAISNTWTREVVAPARVYAWNDSITITAPSGLTDDAAGTHLRLANPDSIIDAGESSFADGRLWGTTACSPPRGLHKPSAREPGRHDVKWNFGSSVAALPCSPS